MAWQLFGLSTPSSRRTRGSIAGIQTTTQPRLDKVKGLDLTLKPLGFFIVKTGSQPVVAAGSGITAAVQALSRCLVFSAVPNLFDRVLGDVSHDELAGEVIAASDDVTIRA